MTKIFFYGASVTAQSNGNGFFNYLPKLENIEFDRFAMGGCHFNDAGFFLQNKIFECSPDVCILDWNSTGQGFFDESKIQYLVLNLLNHRIVPAFMILPNKDGNVKSNRQAERQIYELASKFALQILDLRNIDFVPCLRDSVHTNTFGANEYALKISEWVESSLPLWKSYFNSDLSDALLTICRDHEIQSVTYEENLKVTNSLRIELKPTNINKIEIVLSGSIGPYSPVIDILESGNFMRKIQVWDPWCYYERSSFFSLGAFRLPSSLEDILFVDIVLTNEVPNYSISRQSDFVFLGERYVSLSGIYCDNAQIVSIDAS